MSLFTDRMFRGGILAKGSGFLECRENEKNLSWMDSFPAVYEPKVEYFVEKKKRRRTR